MKKVKFTGEPTVVDAWVDSCRKKSYNISKDEVFKIGSWGRCESVMTDKDEWLCDTDSQLFKDNFQFI